MRREACVQFLQWALPRLGYSWARFRRPYRVLCKRLRGRLEQLALPDLENYREHLARHPSEWEWLDRQCRISISRWLRDRDVWEALRSTLLPELARAALGRGDRRLLVWSAGCGSGEEPLSLSLLWRADLAARFPGLELLPAETDLESSRLDLEELEFPGCYRRGA